MYHEGHDHGGGFMTGLLAGTMIGAGLGLLFAPKSGADTRHDLTDRANALGKTAAEGYRKANEAVAGLADKARRGHEDVRDTQA
jgi:gas vesicle protein